MMNYYLCAHCGFWQHAFAPPLGCPICSDVRHTLPPEGYRFLAPDQAAQATHCSWEEVAPSVLRLANEPTIGIGTCAYLIERPEGNILFEGLAWYDDALLAEIDGRGGVRWASASHPHAYGALWRIQERWECEVAMACADLNWTQAFRVTWPFDERLELAPGLTLLRTGGHFAGHTVLYHGAAQLLFAGDALKIHWDDGRATGLSCHKAFNRQIPLSHDEMQRYREVMQPLAFTGLLTSFDYHLGLGHNAAMRLFETRLADRPSCAPIALSLE
jgi:hypothetical protein